MLCEQWGKFTQRALWFVLLWFMHYTSLHAIALAFHARRSMINSYGPSGSVLLLHLCCRRLGHL